MFCDGWVLKQARRRLTINYSSDTTMKNLKTKSSKSPSKPIGFIGFWLRISIELFLLISLFIIFEVLLWWFLMWIGKAVWNCTVSDQGLMKPPGVYCHTNVWGKDLIKIILEVEPVVLGIPVFILFISMMINFPLFFVFLFFISTLITFVLTLLEKPLHLKEKNAIKFPIMLRTFCSLFRKLSV
jgi:hypothetical protein